MAREEVRIPIKVDGARQAAAELEKIGKSADKGSRGTERLTKRLTKLGSAAAIGAVTAGFVKLGANVQELERRLLSVSESSADAADALELLRGVSARSRSDLGANVQAFQRISIATEQLGLSASTNARLVETLNKALLLGGASAQEAQSALVQLGQALASGTLSGDELRSLRENAAGLTKILADDLGVGIGELKRLGAEGKLTSEVLINSLLSATEEVDEKFSELPTTWGDATTEFKNSLEKIGQIAKPVTDTLARGFSLVASAISDAAEGAKELIDNLASTVGREVIEANIEELEKEAEAVLAELQGTRKISELLQKNIDAGLIENTGELERTNLRLQALQREYNSLISALRVQEGEAAGAPGLSSGRVSPGGAPGAPAAPSAEDPIDVESDPAVQALRASTEKRAEINKDFQALIDAQNAAQHEKDLARYRFQEEILTGVFNTAGDALLEFTRTGEFNFRDFGSAILETLQEILLQALITQAVTALLGQPPSPGGGAGSGAGGVGAGGFGGIVSGLAGAFAGGFANGGDIPSGQFGLVGEEGPEFISGPATITPMGGPIEIIVRDETGRVLDIMRSEEGQRAQLDNMNAKRSQTKRLLS